MKLIRCCIVLLISIFLSVPILCSSTCEFALIIPSYNNAQYYQENLDSACWQNSTNPYHIYYINDRSTDGTGELVAKYIIDNALENKVTLINNEVNIGGGANIYNTIHKYIGDHQIVVILDGDDLFPHDNVLLTLEKYYKDPDIWLTHGILKTFPEPSYWGEKIRDYVFMNKLIRKKAWATALRTFKAGLYKKIKKEDFYYKGEFMKVTWDLAFMLPMLEMCNGKKRHCVLIEEVLYLYRVNTPINDFRLRAQLQKEVDGYVRSLEPYNPLEFL